MTDKFDAIQFLKNRGHVLPLRWVLSVESTIPEILEDLSKASGTTVTKSEFIRILRDNNIY